METKYVETKGLSSLIEKIRGVNRDSATLRKVCHPKNIKECDSLGIFEGFKFWYMPTREWDGTIREEKLFVGRNKVGNYVDTEAYLVLLERILEDPFTTYFNNLALLIKKGYEFDKIKNRYSKALCAEIINYRYADNIHFLINRFNSSNYDSLSICMFEDGNMIFTEKEIDKEGNIEERIFSPGNTRNYETLKWLDGRKIEENLILFEILFNNIDNKLFTNKQRVSTRTLEEIVSYLNRLLEKTSVKINLGNYEAPLASGPSEYLRNKLKNINEIANYANRGHVTNYVNREEYIKTSTTNKKGANNITNNIKDRIRMEDIRDKIEDFADRVKDGIEKIEKYDDIFWYIAMMINALIPLLDGGESGGSN